MNNNFTEGFNIWWLAICLAGISYLIIWIIGVVLMG